MEEEYQSEANKEEVWRNIYGKAELGDEAKGIHRKDRTVIENKGVYKCEATNNQEED